MSDFHDALLDAKQDLLRKQLNGRAAERAELEAEFGQVWDTEELKKDFKIQAFSAPFVMVTRKVGAVSGALVFQHLPRFYWGFTALEEP